MKDKELEERFQACADALRVLNEQLRVQKVRTDRIVQVLRNELPKESLNRNVRFFGTDCHGTMRTWSSWDERTLDDFLVEIIDP